MEERRKQSGQARTKRARKRRQKIVYRQNKAGMFWVSGMVLVLLIAMSVRIVDLYHKNQELKAEELQKMSELEIEQERQEEILAYEKYVTTPEYIEQLAKTKLGLIYPNEIIFKEQKKEQ